MKTVLHLVRHGEVHNPKKILYGRLPHFRISDKGKETVRQTAIYFSRRKVSAIYSSPLLRARQTAKIIADHSNKRISLTRDLTEIGLIFEGMPLVEYKDKIQPFIFDDKYVKMGQESVGQVKKRIMRFLQIIIRRHKNEEVVAVTHGDPIVIFLSQVMGKDFDWDFKKNNYLQVGKWVSFLYNHKTFKWEWTYEKF